VPFFAQNQKPDVESDLLNGFMFFAGIAALKNAAGG
jgi:hypothetical protein